MDLFSIDELYTGCSVNKLKVAKAEERADERWESLEILVMLLIGSSILLNIYLSSILIFFYEDAEFC